MKLIDYKNIAFALIIGATGASHARAKSLAHVDGPNCLNAAMITTGLGKTQRYTSNNEMWAHLKSPLCRRLNNGEARQAYDIGVVLDNGPHADKNIISHAFVQMTPDSVFEKHGYSKSEPYQLIGLEQVFNDYQFDSNPVCKQNQFDRKECHIGTDYYRCESFDQFIEKNKSKIRRHTLNFFQELEKIELDLQQYLKNIDLPENKNKHLEIVRQMQVLADKMMNIPESNVSEENAILKIIANRFVSISGQLNAVQHPELRNLVWQWENQDKNIEDVYEAILSLKIQDDLDLVYADVRKQFTSVMAPLVKSLRNVELRVLLSEEYRSNAGGVSLYKKAAQIEMGYDMHRTKVMTPDAYMAILCHEAGHLLGGKPYSDSTKKPSAQWVSNLPSSAEPQSDYYSPVCMKKVFVLDTPKTIMDYGVTPRVKSLCEKTYNTILEQNICKRSARAGLDLMNYISWIYNSLSGSNIMKVDLDTPEQAGLSVGQLYPSTQCRLDTILAGVLNQKRPSCWYIETGAND